MKNPIAGKPTAGGKSLVPLNEASRRGFIIRHAGAGWHQVFAASDFLTAIDSIYSPNPHPTKPLKNHTDL